ncbi:MAG TPA: hypothetical protein VFX37_15265 [Pseudolabrys sp.]|nr:hypothetical protein [Pseudolabrys sp.]
MAARVLLLGLWTESDDQGVFDWKPITLKMRIMPADNIDIPVLLAELENANVIRQFLHEGKQLGAVRNFCKFQKPKTPKYRPLTSQELRKYVASAYPVSEAPEVGQDRFPQKGEMSPQMEEEGGRKEEVREEGTCPVAKARPSAHLDFVELKKIYPKRLGDYKWALAERKFNSLVKTGVDPKMVLAAARRLTETHAKLGDIGTQFVPMPASWLNSEDFLDSAVTAFESSTEPIRISWDEAVSQFKRTGHWSRHAPASDIGQAPPELLAKYGLLPDGRKLEGASP